MQCREAGPRGELAVQPSLLWELAEPDGNPPVLMEEEAHGETTIKTGDWGHRGRAQ